MSIVYAAKTYYSAHVCNRIHWCQKMKKHNIHSEQHIPSIQWTQPHFISREFWWRWYPQQRLKKLIIHMFQPFIFRVMQYVLLISRTWKLAEPEICTFSLWFTQSNTQTHRCKHTQSSYPCSPLSCCLSSHKAAETGPVSLGNERWSAVLDPITVVWMA